MRTFRIKKKWYLRRHFTVTNEAGDKDLYHMELVSFFGRKSRLVDESGKVCAEMVRKGWLFPVYHVTSSGKPLAEIRPEPSTFRESRVNIEAANGQRIEVVGSGSGANLIFSHKGKPIAHASRKKWSFADAYRVNLEDGENELLVFATVAVIDWVYQGAIMGSGGGGGGA